MSKSPRSFRFVVAHLVFAIAVIAGLSPLGIIAQHISLNGKAETPMREIGMSAEDRALSEAKAAAKATEFVTVQPEVPQFLKSTSDLNLFSSMQPLTPGTCDTAGPIEVESSGGTAAGVPTAYASLALAFTAINGATLHLGTITIDVCGNSTEVGTATLNQVAGVTSVTMSPAGGAARTISGAIAAGSPLIDLNGADNVTINGLNTGGNSLTISNTSTGTTAGTSTIRFIADATSNTVTNCSIQGSSASSLATVAGTILFSTGTTTGNDNNTISNNQIGPAGANLPSKAIMASGTSSAIENDGALITGNNIFDYFLATGSHSAINVITGNEAWTISSNKFYQTAARTITTAASRHSAITLNNSTGGFTVSGNTVGFAAANGTGTYTISGTSNEFRAIDAASVRTTAPATEIQNNTITAINQTSSRASTTTASSAFIALAMGTTDGLLNASGNTIGSLDGSTTIVINETSTTASTAPVLGIYNFSFFSTNISSNNIGSITIQSTGTVVGFRGILVNTTTGVSATISNNVIAGITDTQIGSYAIYGIQSSLPNLTATGNIIRNMTGSSNGSALIISAGILASGSTGANTISQNTIHSLSNASGAVANSIYGMSLSLPAATNLVERNLIHSFSLTTTLTGSQIWGISGGATGTTTYQNNMIRLGHDAAGASITLPTSMIGIRDAAGATNQFYHNTVYVGGTGVLATPTASNSYCFFSDVVTVTRNHIDNIFWNARSNAVGGGVAHLATREGGTAANPAGLTSNGNVLYFSGTDGATGVFNAVIVSTLANWRTATGQDVNSFSSDPQLIAPTGTAATVDLHLHPTNSTVAEGNGILVASVTNDFDGQIRAGLTPVDIGADAGNFNGVDLAAPSITYTAFANTISSANRVLSITATDATGVDQTATFLPRIYFKKSTDAGYVSTQCVSTGGTALSGTYDCTIDYTLVGGGSVTANDIIQYFVIAQDTAGTPNVGSNPAGVVATNVNSVTTPPAPNTYNILATISGTKTVGAGGTYGTLTAAVAAINAAQIDGPVTLSLLDPSYSAGETFPLTLNANTGSSATNTVTIKPASGITTSISGSSASCVFNINGADYVTIDGSNTVGGTSRDMTFTNTNAGITSAVVCVTSLGANAGATNNTVKNTNIVGSTVTATPGTLVGIFSGSSTISITSAGADNDNNTIQNNNITKTSYGIYSGGASAANKNTGTVITQNVMNAGSPNNITTGGVLANFEDGIAISSNDISVLKHDGTTGTTNTAFGIALGVVPNNTVTTFTGSDVTNATVSRNRINGVTQLSATGYSTFGIVINSVTSGTTSVANNMVSGVISPATAADFSASIVAGGGTGSTTNIYFNSVSMAGARGAGAAYPSYGLAINSGNPTVNVLDNIFYNTQTGGTGKAYAIANASTTFTNFTSNNNDLYVSGASTFVGQTGGLGTAGTDRTALSDWQTATGKDANSISADPIFVSATDLHINNSGATVSPVARKGVTIAGITTDFDGQTRKATPDIGADEFVTYVLTTTATAGGSVTTPATSPTIVNPSPVATNIVATPNAGFNFVNWTVTAGTATFGDANQASTTVTLTGDATIQANFAPQNTPPTITPVGVTRQEGSPSSNSTIANVTDDGGNGAVTVTVNGGASATVNGVTVSNIVNTGGTVTADVVAACGAVSPATFTLTASDGVLSTNATLTVTVDPNTPPSVTYNNVTTAYLTGTTNPTATATDNGSIASFALQSQGTYTGGISVNPTSGLVTFTNPTAGGTITIRSTDNCGLFTDSTFTVTVGAAPVFTIDDVTVNEGNSGTTNFTFTVSKTGTTGGNATVDYATAPGTATSPSDYTAITTTTLTFLPAETTKTITVLVNGDTLYENTEDFFVNLTNPVSATIGDNQGLGTITNDDTAPTISITDVTLAEGNSGTTTFGFTVSLSAVSGLPTTVHYQTADGTATTADSDYVAVGDTTLTIPAGQLSVTEGSGPPSNVQVQVNGDIVFETNETFFVNLSSPTNATILDNQGVGTINNDDGAPSYSIDDVSHLEGDSGTTSYVFTITRTGPTAIASAVTATTADNSATTANNDYQSNSATLNFAASTSPTSTQTFTVLANGDTVVEPNETFFVNLTNATGGATISDSQGVGTITNDDAVPVVQFSSQSYREDESQAAVITINRTGDTSGLSTVTFATSGGSANGGAACGGNVDYISIAPSNVTFAPGQTTQTINVTICGDTNGEYPVDETIGLTLAAVTNASVGTSATLNINDTASQYLQSAASTPAETPHAPIDMTLAQNASPYPSQIVVAGAPTLIGSMRVTLYDVWHLQPDNIDVLLVGPNGQKYLLMADVGGTVTPIPENSPVTITFNDLVSAHLPDAGSLTTGQWQPTVCETNSPFLGVTGSYVTPGCASPNTAAQSMFGVPGTGFGNTNPNGTWMLYVRDDGGSFRPVGAESFSGSIKGGWGLEFIAPTAAELSISGRVTTVDGRGITNAVVTVSGGSLVQPVTVIAGRNGTYTVGGLTAGETYIVSVRSRRFAFANPTRLVTLTDNVTDADFTADR